MTEQDFYKWLGKQAKEKREQAEISLSLLARRVGVKRALLYQFEEHGKKISAFRLNLVLKALNMYTIEDLLTTKKKKSVDITISVPHNGLEEDDTDWKERFRQFLQTAEDVVSRMNHDAPLRPPRTTQQEQDEDQQGCKA